MSVNIASFSGNITRDSELRETAGGTSVLQFSVAVNERRKVGDTWEDYANFFDCKVFGKRAIPLAEHLKKGTRVFVQGRMHQGRWETNGEKRSKVEIIVEEIDFVASKPQAQKEEFVDTYYFTDDIPF